MELTFHSLAIDLAEKGSLPENQFKKILIFEPDVKSKHFISLPSVFDQKRVGVVCLFGLEKSENLDSVSAVSATLMNEAFLVRSLYDIEEKQRKQIQEEFEARTKAMFLANISDELRVPLSGVLRVVQVMNRDDLNPECKNCINLIHSSIIHVMNISK